MNRRQFVLAGAAAAGAVGVVRAAFMPALALGSNRFYRVVFDTRFPASRALAAALPRTLAGAVGVTGDVTRLWFEDLSHRWAAGGVVVAGMTTPATLFCLEQLAKDHWRRVVMRIEHQEPGGQGVRHRITCGAEDAATAVSRFASPAPWPEAAANSLAGCRGNAGTVMVTRSLGDGWYPAGERSRAGLVSWVIA